MLLYNIYLVILQKIKNNTMPPKTYQNNIGYIPQMDYLSMWMPPEETPEIIENVAPQIPYGYLPQMDYLNTPLPQKIEPVDNPLPDIPDIKNPYDAPNVFALASAAGDIINTNANDRIAMKASNNAVLGNAVSGNTWQDIFSNNNRMAGAVKNIRAGINDYSNVKNNYNLMNAYQNVTSDPVKGPSQLDTMSSFAGAVLGDTAKGAAMGSTFGPIGTIVGGAAGLLSGVARTGIGYMQNQRNRSIANSLLDKTDRMNNSNFYDTAYANNDRQKRMNMYNIFQEGGFLPNDNNITEFNTGGTHQQNPYGGIKQGIASDGKPNYVEEAEVRYNDYVYSARNTPSEALLKKYNLI